MDTFDRKILLVDDEPQILELEISYLNKQNVKNIVTASSCAQARSVTKEQNPDLIVLDIMLPDGNGFMLYKELRQMTQVPILFLSARDEDVDRLIGLGLGADDYITKPFLPEELFLRIGNILRRTYPQQLSEKLILGDHIIDMERNTITTPNETIAMTAKEFHLLKCLLDNKGHIVTVDQLCDAIWAEENFGYENTLMVHIRRLREKIEDDPSHPKYLITARGLGYKLNL